MQTAAERYAMVYEVAGRRLLGEPESVESYSNDTWYVRSASDGDAVLRVCWIGDVFRLRREAAVGTAAPHDVGYPEVLGSGQLTRSGRTITWLLTRRLAGTSLRRAWPGLDDAVRDRALGEVARPLRTLQRWRMPSQIVDLVGTVAPTGDPATVVGATLVPLPLDRVRRLLGPASDRAPEHSAVIAEAWRWLVGHTDLLPRLDDPVDGVTHGDLHLDNVWWDGDRVTGLLDLEWVRFAPPWLDLATVRDNSLAGDEFAVPHARLLAALRADAPELEVADLDRRLTAVELAHQVRQVLVWPAPGPDPAVDHPVRMLRRLLDAG